MDGSYGEGGGEGAYGFERGAYSRCLPDASIEPITGSRLLRNSSLVALCCCCVTPESSIPTGASRLQGLECFVYALLSRRVLLCDRADAVQTLQQLTCCALLWQTHWQA